MNAPDLASRSADTASASFMAPTTIADYLDRLRRALAGADPALVQKDGRRRCCWSPVCCCCS